MAVAALKWTDRVLKCSAKQSGSMLVSRPSPALAGSPAMPLCPCDRLRAVPDASVAKAAVKLAQSELDRFLSPVDPSWHGHESAAVRTFRVRIPG
jgi:hypothetical protein